MHPKFGPTRFRTHGLKLMTVHFMSLGRLFYNHSAISDFSLSYSMLVPCIYCIWVVKWVCWSIHAHKNHEENIGDHLWHNHLADCSSQMWRDVWWSDLKLRQKNNGHTMTSNILTETLQQQHKRACTSVLQQPTSPAKRGNRWIHMHLRIGLCTIKHIVPADD